MKRLAFAASLFTLSLLPCLAFAMPIEFVSTHIDPATQLVDVTIQFFEPPDFFTLATDGSNAQKDSFQFFGFDHAQPDNNGAQEGPYANVTSVTRGEEIHWGDGLVIREALTDTLPTDPTAFTTQSGGWGGTLETVPFVLNGETLTYNATLRGMGDLNGDGIFGYGVMTTRFGAITGGAGDSIFVDANGNSFGQAFFGQCASNTVCQIPTQSVPVPDMLWPTVMGMIGLAGVMAWRRRGEAASAP